MEDLEAGLSNLCRLCGEVDVECSNLFDETEQEENLLSKIQLSIRIAISQDDGLPSGICNACRDKLVDYTSFYQQCHDTQERLQEFLCIESAMQKTIHADPPEIKFEAVTEHEDEADDFYYEDAEGGADENVDDENVEYMETEENNEIPEEEEYILADTEKDRRSFAASEREKTLPVRNSSPGKKKDVLQVNLTNSNSLQEGKRKTIGRLNNQKEDPLVLPLAKQVQNSKMHITAPISKIVDNCLSYSSGSSSSCTQTSRSLVSSSEPPPLVQIVTKTVVPLEVPPLVPIKKPLSQKTSTQAPSVKILEAKTNTSSSPTVKAAPSTSPLLLPFVKLSRLPESSLLKLVKGYSPNQAKPSEKLSTSKKNEKSANTLKPTGSPTVVQNKLSMEPPPLVRRLETKQGIESFNVARKRVAVELPSVATSSGAKGRVFIMAEENTPLLIPENALPVIRPKKLPVKAKSPSKKKKGDLSVMANNDPTKTLNPSRGEGRAFIMTGDKTVAVEVGVVQNTKKKKKRKPPSLPATSVPYLILKNGELVNLDMVEKIPLDQIPTPPVVVMHVSKNVATPPTIGVEGHINFPDISSYTGFPVDLGSGLHVRSYPETTFKEFKVSLPETQNNSEENDKLLVVQNSWLRQHKKKGIFVRKHKRRCRPSSCPEATVQVEDIPTDPPQFRCKICDVLYVDKKRCEYHVINKHMTDSCAYQCKECGRKFATNFLRAAHIRLRHVRAPDLICSICGAKFRSIEVLKGHELRHTLTEPPFKCSTCGKGFYTKANCVKHQLDLHSEKKVVCDICGEAFSSGGRLNEHRFTHLGGIKCNECGKVIKSRSRLRAHKAAAHSKEQNFLFCACGKKFRVFAFYHNHRKTCSKFLMKSASDDLGTENNEEFEYSDVEEGEGDGEEVEVDMVEGGYE
ncbi:uncharacterized protein LOC113210290 isoform X2 [Frankliniella occidentalis]|uniref:Uncharacterized protein LOC113210290 isoform X2 n=1 Tax=Frankliniella occidentalis TaxID=133901 RepID=A0A6J1SZT6_FRAOC|nr:uncharacterized protein LOC113210290 isoform X2 [Frankliniella occidentalis]